jgi:hypothetical protein
LADEDASDDGQWGVAFNLFVPEWNDTEFGFYMLNYHRKLPDLVVRNYGGLGIAQTYGGVTPDTPNWTYEDNIATSFASGDAYSNECAANPNFGDCNTLAMIAGSIDVASLNVKYFEDVKLYGFSWNTVIPWTDTAFSGEIAFHHDIPVQTLHAFQGLLEDAVIACNYTIGEPGLRGERCENQLSTREDVVVTQLFFFHDFNNFTFADDVGLFMEIGWIHAVDLNDGKVITPFSYDGTEGGGGYFNAGSSPVPGHSRGQFINGPLWRSLFIRFLAL